MKTKFIVTEEIEGPEVITSGGAKKIGILLALASEDNPLVKKIITTAYQKMNLKNKDK